MNILISPLSQTPIYEQIKQQVRESILSGKLKDGQQIPSIRILAKDLKVGIITVKRAYDDLCSEGLLISLAGRGVYVSHINREQIKTLHLDMLKEKLIDIKDFCDGASISKKEIETLLTIIYGG